MSFVSVQFDGQFAHSPDDVSGTPNGHTWFLLLTFALHQSCSVGDVVFSLYGHFVNAFVRVGVCGLLASVIYQLYVFVSAIEQSLFKPFVVICSIV